MTGWEKKTIIMKEKKMEEKGKRELEEKKERLRNLGQVNNNASSKYEWFIKLTSSPPTSSSLSFRSGYLLKTEDTYMNGGVYWISLHTILPVNE